MRSKIDERNDELEKKILHGFQGKVFSMSSFSVEDLVKSVRDG